MGNAASVSPSESEEPKKNKGQKGRRRRASAEQVEDSEQKKSVTKDVRARPTGRDASCPATPADIASNTQQRIDRILEKVLESQNDPCRPEASADTDQAPRAIDKSNGGTHDRSHVEATADIDVVEGLSHQVDLVKPAEARDPRRDSPSASDTSSTGSYTTSSYSGSDATESGDDASDHTFFIPEDKRQEGKEDSLDNADDSLRITVEGEGKHRNFGTPADDDIVVKSDIQQQEDTAGDDSVAKKRGRLKRRRPGNRHYIKDETMRTLFGLLPFYGGGNGPLDQMVKATLASVGPNTIDARDEEGNTLLILCCQHACEDLVEPILAKGASPTAVNGVGSCALHFTCFAGSLSLESAEALLWGGADPCSVEATYGCTPLHYAADAGDADLCALLLEHGAQPQTKDFYDCTAAKYAKDAGHEAIIDLLGNGNEDYHLELQGSGLGADEEDGAESVPSGGLWLRHVDPETGFTYLMNDESGESWWETDLMAVAKDFFAAGPTDESEVANGKGGQAHTPPLGVREWLVQEQVRSWLIAIFSRADPLRLMEVDLVMHVGKANFQDMLKGLLDQYGMKDLTFLRESSSPKLESLGVYSHLPSRSDSGGEDTAVVANVGQGANVAAAEGEREEGSGVEKGSAEAIATLAVEQSGSGTSYAGTEGGHTVRECKTPLSTSPSPRNLAKQDSPATLRAEADRLYQEAVLQHEKEIAEERARQKSAMDEQQSTVRSLDEMLRKRTAAVALARGAEDEASSEADKLRSTLADDSAGQDAADRMSEELTSLKADLAAERMRLSHMTEALEASKGSAEERDTKHREMEEERCCRLARLRSDCDGEVEKIRVEAAAEVQKSEEAWSAERSALEQELSQQVTQVTKALEETIQNAAHVLSEAAAATMAAVDASKEALRHTDEARAWMRGSEPEHAQSKHIDHANKQLHTSLRREMERAKQLHNQIEDTKGQTRMYARVRPLNSKEREAGCKEVCVRDGKQTLVLLASAENHFKHTNVFQSTSMDVSATAAGQSELYREVAGLGVSLADGHSLLLLAVGAPGAGKTLTLVGIPDEVSGKGLFFVGKGEAEPKLSSGGAMDGSHGDRKGAKKGKAKAGAEGSTGEAGGGVAERVVPLAGVLPRIVAETFGVLTHRDAQSAFAVWVSAAAVPSAECQSDGGAAIECLLPRPPTNDVPTIDEQQGAVGGSFAQTEERDRQSLLFAPPDDSMWGYSVAASSPSEAMGIVEDARLRMIDDIGRTEPRVAGMRHFLSRFVVTFVNRSTNEMTTSELVVVEVAENGLGDAWPAALAERIGAHAAATNGTRADDTNRLIGMLQGCLADTAKVVTFLCVSPADRAAEETERTLNFGKACEKSGDDGASQLRDLKRELARLKKDTKGSRKNAPSQLPRPAGGRRR